MRRIAIVNPIFLFCFSWGISGFLYVLTYSRLLLYDTYDILFLIIFLMSAFIFGVRFIKIIKGRHKFEKDYIFDSFRIRNLWKKVYILFYVWVFISVFEIFASGGLPILWLILGIDKTYFDFGINSIHGFANSLLLALSVISYYLYLHTKFSKFLYIPGFIFIWSIIVLTRNMLIVNFLQLVILYIYFNGVRLQNVLRFIIIVIFIIVLFGILGDFRSGAENFIALTQIDENSFLLNLPSGFSWVYMYVTTPLNNLMYQVNEYVPSYSIMFPNTTSLLFPSVIRIVVFDEIINNQQYLVTHAFNVSTAFSPPFMDFGWIGLFIYATFLGFIGSYTYYSNKHSNMLMYSAIGQCIILSIFLQPFHVFTNYFSAIFDFYYF